VVVYIPLIGLTIFLQVDYVLAELTGYAKIADNERGIEVRNAYVLDSIEVSDDFTERLLRRDLVL
jgi:hypothetical protein